MHQRALSLSLVEQRTETKRAVETFALIHRDWIGVVRVLWTINGECRIFRSGFIDLFVEMIKHRYTGFFPLFVFFIIIIGRLGENRERKTSVWFCFVSMGFGRNSAKERQKNHGNPHVRKSTETRTVVQCTRHWWPCDIIRPRCCCRF